MIDPKKRNVLLISIIIILFLAILTGNSPAVVIDRIVAKINGEIVTLSEVQELRHRIYNQVGRGSFPSDGTSTQGILSEKEVLERLVDRKLQMQKAEKLGIEVTTIEIDNTLNEIMAKNKVNKEELIGMLSRDGSNMEDFRKYLKEEMTLARVLNSEVRSKIVVDGYEIKKYYESHQREFSKPEKVRLRHIFITVNDFNNMDERENKLTIARKVLERYRLGETFSSLARQFSDDPSARKGGDIGYIKMEDLMEPLRERARTLASGEISSLIESKVGYHIIFMEEKVGSNTLPLDEVKKEIERQLFQKKLEERLKSWVSQLREKAHIEISYQTPSGGVN